MLKVQERLYLIKIIVITQHLLIRIKIWSLSRKKSEVRNSHLMVELAGDNNQSRKYSNQIGKNNSQISRH